MNVLSSALGRYEAVGNPADADLVVAHSFGTVTKPGSANRALANFALSYADGRPILADRTLVDAFPEGDDQVDHVVEGPISNNIGQGLGVWGVLLEAREYMRQYDLNSPLMVAHAHLIGRVAMQAKKLGIESIIPEGLPRHFDMESDQRWTRSELMWLPRELIGSAVLRLQGKL